MEGGAVDAAGVPNEKGAAPDGAVVLDVVAVGVVVAAGAGAGAGVGAGALSAGLLVPKENDPVLPFTP